jgi:hypothetical protein
VVELPVLAVLEAGKADATHPIQRLAAALDELGRGYGTGRLVRDELRQPERHPRRRLRADHHLAAVGRRVGLDVVVELRLDEVLDTDAERHPAMGGAVPRRETHPVDCPALFVQHPLLKARRLPRVPWAFLSREVSRVGVPAIDDLRGQHDRRRVLRQHDLVLDRRDVSMLQ